MTATVNAPASFAALAMIGLAPVPVPPPIPAARNTISAPFTICLISDKDWDAAISPILGIPPAPLPLFSPLPNKSLLEHMD